MEVWAPGLRRPIPLQEILTVKSDDVTGRVKTHEAIVKGHNVPKPGVPESFKVLIKELQSLCLDMKVLDAQGNEIRLKDDDEGTPIQPGARMTTTRMTRTSVMIRTPTSPPPAASPSRVTATMTI